MNLALVKSDTERALDGLFAAARDRLAGSGAVAEARRKAFDDFASRGLPHRRVEEWKYTDLRATMREVLPLGPQPDQAALARAAAALKALEVRNARLLVLVDGSFVPQLSNLGELDQGLSIGTLRDVLDGAGGSTRERLVAPGGGGDVMVALNTALMTDGVVIEIADGTHLKEPLHIVHVATASSAALVTRSCLSVGAKAAATLVESFVAAEGAAGYQVHDALVVDVGDGARLDHVRLMHDAPDAFNVTSGFMSISGHAEVNSFGLTSGGLLSRYQGFITFTGEHSRLATNGVNLLTGRQHGDTTLFVDHAVPNCMSRELFRSVLEGRSHSAFQGRIMVRPDAQKTDAKMMTRALLLSDEAEADNKPELEIFADDVTCGHGATAGALDENLLFYLRARGLSEKDAQALLITAFIGEAVESIADDGLREVAMAAAERWLATRG